MAWSGLCHCREPELVCGVNCDFNCSNHSVLFQWKVCTLTRVAAMHGVKYMYTHKQNICAIVSSVFHKNFEFLWKIFQSAVSHWVGCRGMRHSRRVHPLINTHCTAVEWMMI